MVFHFDTRALAEKHLADNGWCESASDLWVSRDRTCRATIHPVPGMTAVAVAVSETTQDEQA